MGWKTNSVSMPMTSAGIIGISTGENVGGIQIDPRTIIVATILFAGVIKLASLIFV